MVMEVVGEWRSGILMFFLSGSSLNKLDFQYGKTLNKLFQYGKCANTPSALIEVNRSS